MYYPSVHLKIAKLFVITSLVAVKNHDGNDYVRPELLGALVAEDEFGNVFICNDKTITEVMTKEYGRGTRVKSYEDGMGRSYRDMWSHMILPIDRQTEAPYFKAIMVAEKKEIPFRPWNGLTLDEEELLSEEDYIRLCK